MRLIIEARLEGSDPANSASTEPATIVAVGAWIKHGGQALDMDYS
jgi:hypothetical protein